MKASVKTFSVILTAFPLNQPASRVERSVVHEFLRSRFNDEWIEKCWVDVGERIIDDLVAEFNRRDELGLSVRYELIDDIGSEVRGQSIPGEEALYTFQDALLELTDVEFERLAARVLAGLAARERGQRQRLMMKAWTRLGWCR